MDYARRELFKVFGYKEATFLQHLIDLQQDAEMAGTAHPEDWVTASQNKILEETGLTPALQRNIVNSLLHAGIIETKVMGMPAKKWYKILYKE